MTIRILKAISALIIGLAVLPIFCVIFGFFLPFAMFFEILYIDATISELIDSYNHG